MPRKSHDKGVGSMQGRSRPRKDMEVGNQLKQKEVFPQPLPQQQNRQVQQKQPQQQMRQQHQQQM